MANSSGVEELIGEIPTPADEGTSLLPKASSEESQDVSRKWIAEMWILTKAAMPIILASFRNSFEAKFVPAL